MPRFGVGEGLASLEGAQRAEGFEFEHLGVGEGFVVAAEVGVGGIFFEGDRFEKEATAEEIPDPALAMAEADFCW